MRGTARSLPPAQKIALAFRLLGLSAANLIGKVACFLNGKTDIQKLKGSTANVCMDAASL
jgi:hypothetical protein